MINVLQINSNLLKGSGVSENLYHYYKKINKNIIHFDFFIFRQNKVTYIEEIEKMESTIYYSDIKNIKTLKNDFRKVLENKKYDIIELNSPTYSFIFLKIAKQMNIPVRICHSHSCARSNSFVKNILSKFANINLTKYANFYFSCSKKSGEYWYGKKIVNSNKFMIAVNYVDKNKLKFNEDFRLKKRKELNYGDKEIVLGYLGRISTDKNLLFLLDLLENLNKYSKKKYKLMLVGDGLFYEGFLSNVKKRKLEKQVDLVGLQKNIGEWLSIMDAFVFPSKTEGLGMSLVEAQMNGMKCFCFKNIPDEANVGLLVKLPNDVKIWADEIETNNFKRTNVESDMYDVDKNVKDLEKKYVELIKR